MYHRFSDAKRLYIPYFAQETADSPVERQVASLMFRVQKGTVDRRVIKKMVRRWVRDNLGRTLHTRELRLLMRTVHPVATY